MGYLCDNEDGNPAVVLITNLENGDVQALCGPCLPLWVAAAASSFAEAGAYGPPGSPTPNGEGPEEGGPAPDPDRPKRRRTGRQGPPPALTSESSPFPDPTPVDS